MTADDRSAIGPATPATDMLEQYAGFLDDAALQMAIDEIEDGHVPPELVEQLRGLVRDRATGRIEELEAEVRNLGRTVMHQRQDLAVAHRRSGLDRALGDPCKIGGPWQHVAIDEDNRGNHGVRLMCGHCNRGPTLTLREMDGPPQPDRPYRAPLVNLNTHRFADGREVSPAIQVGRCGACGTWHMG